MFGPSGLMTVSLAGADAVNLGRAIQQGKSIQLALAPADMTQSEEIDTYLPGYVPFGGYRGDQIAPIFLVDKDIGQYRIRGLSNVFRLLHTETSYLAPVATVDPETSLASYAVMPHALGAVITPQTERQSNFDVRASSARLIADALALRREYAILTFATTLNNWNTAQRTTLTADYQWDGGVLSNPILDLQARVRASTQMVTDIYMGQTAAHAFMSHAKVRDFIRAAIGDAGMQAAAIAVMGVQGAQALDFAVPGLPPIHVAGGKILNDTTGNLDEIIGPHVVLTSNPPGGGEFDSIQTLKTFRARGASGTGFVNREFRVENQGLEGVDYLVAGYSEVVVMPSNSAGGLIRSVVA